jgi:hypothetical protein
MSSRRLSLPASGSRKAAIMLRSNNAVAMFAIRSGGSRADGQTAATTAPICALPARYVSISRRRSDTFRIACEMNS